MDSSVATSRRLTLGLTIAGAASGAIGGAVLTVLGKIVAGAPPATAANYLWNVALFGVVGAVFGPAITWGTLRHVPLWRTVVEPLAAGVGGAIVGVLAGSGTLFLVLPVVGIGAAIARLDFAYRTRIAPAIRSGP